MPGRRVVIKRTDDRPGVEVVHHDSGRREEENGVPVRVRKFGDSVPREDRDSREEGEFDPEEE